MRRGRIGRYRLDVKWIGNGVSGGLIDAQVMGLTSQSARITDYDEVKTRFSFKPTWTSTPRPYHPYCLEYRRLQPGAEIQDYTEVSGGLSDIMLDFSKSIGMEGEYSLMFNLTLPTGQYDIKRGVQTRMQYLPTALQCGSGLYNATIGIGKTIDVEKGLWIVEAYYSNPFELNFYGKNQFINSQPDQYNALNVAWNLYSTTRAVSSTGSSPTAKTISAGTRPPSLNATSTTATAGTSTMCTPTAQSSGFRSE